MADAAELSEYYQAYYEKDHYEAVAYKELILGHFSRIKTLPEAAIKQESRYLKNLAKGSKFLDVGCGLDL
ncbi:MAG: SAM-dependent methyltransferase, partial [Algoriphagus sp. 32-45-6]